MNLEDKYIYFSRYNKIRYLKELSESEYLIYGESFYFRQEFDEENEENKEIISIDFEGGPMISIEDNLNKFFEGLNKKVIKIEQAENIDTKICFKLTVVEFK